MRTYSEEKVKGTLYGLAIGDAMGATTEFQPQSYIKKKYKKRTDIIGKGWLNLYPGEVTDPTEMAFCICDALEKTAHYRGRSNYADKFLTQCCQTFVNWLASHPVDAENCCKHAIKTCAGKHFQVWFRTSYNPDIRENSNLFRCIPLILSRHRRQYMIEQSRLTHNSRVCDQNVARVHEIMLSCLRGTEITTEVFPQVPPRYRNVEYTVDNALYHLETTTSFENAILEAVYHGGDTDAIAALTGCFAGALYGFSTIPQRWIDQLRPEVKEKLDHYCDFLCGKTESTIAS